MSSLGEKVRDFAAVYFVVWQREIRKGNCVFSSRGVASVARLTALVFSLCEAFSAYIYAHLCHEFMNIAEKIHSC